MPRHKPCELHACISQNTDRSRKRIHHAPQPLPHPLAAPSAQAGFSLIEIIIVVVLIGGIVAFAASRILAASDRAKVNLAKAQVQTLAEKIQQYRDGHRQPAEHAGRPGERSRATPMAGSVRMPRTAELKDPVEPRRTNTACRATASPSTWSASARTGRPAATASTPTSSTNSEARCKSRQRRMNAAMKTRRASMRVSGRGAAGFTLLEMLVVLVDHRRGHHAGGDGVDRRSRAACSLRSSTKQIAAQLRYTRAQAIATGLPQRFTIDPRGHALAGAERTPRQDSRHRWASTSPARAQVQPQRGRGRDPVLPRWRVHRRPRAAQRQARGVECRRGLADRRRCGVEPAWHARDRHEPGRTAARRFITQAVRRHRCAAPESRSAASP